jgi:hypothetical protein
MNVQAFLVRGGAAVTGTALLAVSMWLYAVRPDVQAEELEPIRTGGRIGADVTTPDFRIRVQGVVAARSLASTLGKPQGTDGVFLVVRIQAMSRKEPVKLRSVVLETPGGFTYRPDPRLGTSSATVSEFQPLIWSRTAYIFEIPPRAAAGARLVAGTGGLLSQLSSAAEIDLGLTSSKADQLVRGAAPAYDPRSERP